MRVEAIPRESDGFVARVGARVFGLPLHIMGAMKAMKGLGFEFKKRKSMKAKKTKGSSESPDDKEPAKSSSPTVMKVSKLLKDKHKKKKDKGSASPSSDLKVEVAGGFANDHEPSIHNAEQFKNWTTRPREIKHASFKQQVAENKTAAAKVRGMLDTHFKRDELQMLYSKVDRAVEKDPALKQKKEDSKKPTKAGKRARQSQDNAKDTLVAYLSVKNWQAAALNWNAGKEKVKTDKETMEPMTRGQLVIQRGFLEATRGIDNNKWKKDLLYGTPRVPNRNIQPNKEN
jgi:hypothetical protein